MKKSNVCLICNKSFSIKGPSCIKNHIIINNNINNINNIITIDIIIGYFNNKDSSIIGNILPIL